MTRKKYCGVGKVPSGADRGSMKDCADMGQIRYYGTKKVDSKIVQYMLTGRKTKQGTKSALEKRRAKLYIEKARYSSRLKTLGKKLQAEDDKDAKKKLQKEIAEVEKILKRLTTEIDIVEAARKKAALKRSTGSKKRGSKKGSKKGGSKRKGSK